MSSSSNKEMYIGRSSSEQSSGIYLGSRGEDFKSLICSVLNRANLKDKYLKMLTNSESMLIYSSAFTSDLVDPSNNYQVLEQIGDLSGNKFIVGYIYNKFPQLNCSDGVKVVARLRINYGSKQCFSEIARKLGFWSFISATNDLRQRKMKPLLEDVFEAFLGATEQILDKKRRVGVGYAIVYDILSSIFDEMNISLKYEDLYDAKTRLKELFDLFESQLGPLVYTDKKNDMITVSSVFYVKGGGYQTRHDGSINKNKIIGGKYVKIGEGSASLKSDSQQNAANVAIKTLNDKGFSKPVPEIYQKFNNGEIPSETQEDYTKETVSDLLKELKADDESCSINSMCWTKEKSKYQNNYQSTLISMFCRQRNKTGVKSCIKMTADPNIFDTDGMTSLDLLFIGKTDENIVKYILKKLLKHTNALKVHKGIISMYYSKYIDEYFKEVVALFEMI